MASTAGTGFLSASLISAARCWSHYGVSQLPEQGAAARAGDAPWLKRAANPQTIDSGNQQIGYIGNTEVRGCLFQSNRLP